MQMGVRFPRVEATTALCDEFFGSPRGGGS